MNLSAPFIHRPIATSLLALGLLLAGALAFRFLPIAPIPSVDFPTIHVGANLPGADPVTVATSVAAPLERRFAQIAGVSEMTSSSTLGSANITIQFDLGRSIDSAARDVQAAINAATGDLPANLVTRPSYRKANPSAAPIMILALTSDTKSPGEVYNYATDVVAQQLSQVEGVSEVTVNGSQKSSVRVQIDPARLAALGLSMEDVRTFLSKTSSNLPKGVIDGPDSSYTIRLNDQLDTAADYRDLVAFQRNGTAIRLGDLGATIDSVENTRQAGWYNGRPAVLLIIFKQADANIIETVDHIHALIPQFERWMPPAIKLAVQLDRTGTIRASVHQIEFTLLVCVALVVMTVFLFLRRLWATVIPSFTVPLALTGTFGVMYLCGYTLDNLSLMALAVAVGFVVDDAIVVLENIVRHMDAGLTPLQAALKGSRQIGFTIVSISLSLVAVFTPLIFMSGLVGRLMHEFAVTLAAAILISALVSLTFTPMMCARFLRHEKSETEPNRLFRFLEESFNRLQRTYGRGLDWVLDHQRLMLGVTGATMAATVWLYVVVPKGFFPNVDNGYMIAITEAAQDISFKSLAEKQQQVTAVVLADPAVKSAAAFMSGGSNSARMFIQLKPLNVRKVDIQVVIDRLRKKLRKIDGVALFMQAAQDLRVGGRSSKSQYQYTLQSADLDELSHWSNALVTELKTIPQFQDVTSDQQSTGLQARVVINRTAAARLNVKVSAIDAALYDSFGQRQVSTIYDSLTQHHVILEATPRYQLDPSSLDRVYVKADTGVMVPLDSLATVELTNTPLSISHQGQFPATTVSFNLEAGYSLGEATKAINNAFDRLHIPGSVRGSFAGTAKVFQESQSSQPLLLLAALAAVYLILGILYESLIHPLTIISTLPSAGVGALLALLITGYDLSIVALIGILLLIGIVKKNAILMIDFALQAEREQALSSREAIRQACLVRFRPIMMTTMAAICGALPLALEQGIGAELHRPLGIAIVGGLVVSQLLTLFTTPVVYILLDRVRHRTAKPALVAEPAHAA
ncbi:MAG TPA: efflux RND transporter permease subunit [Rariglobus sp.]|jgi:hydrophobe/amphiphile efflux-1 (HAE1) family protein|nr:efflux RND transporter permease subunit [Rariglobus sp.]